MRPDEIKKLLGGYATGTLTEQERRTLFRAALQNQGLFDALADEQALRELLDDPGARGRLLAALEERRPALLEGLRAWLSQPGSWAVAGGLAAAFALAAVLIQMGKPPAIPEPTLVAEREGARSPEPEAEAPPPPPAPPLAYREKAPRAAAPEPEVEAEREAILEEQPARPAAVVSQPPPEAGESRAETAASVRAAARHGARQLFHSSQAPVSRAVGVGEESKSKTAIGAVKSDRSSRRFRTAPGLRYHVLRSDPAGGFTPAEAGGEFRAGDLVRLAVETNVAGYLLLFRMDPSGRWQPLYGIRAEAGTRYEIPPAAPIRLEGPPGEFRLLLTLSQTELRGAPDASARDSLLVESVRETVAGGPVDVHYAVDPAASLEAPLDVEIRLNFR